jgi:hypothetical protein
VVLYLSLLAFLYALVPSLIHRRQLDLAFESWHKNPTSQNEPFLSFAHKQRCNIIIQPEGSAIAALVLWVAGFACPSCSSLKNLPLSPNADAHHIEVMIVGPYH